MNKCTFSCIYWATEQDEWSFRPRTSFHDRKPSTAHDGEKDWVKFFSELTQDRRCLNQKRWNQLNPLRRLSFSKGSKSLFYVIVNGPVYWSKLLALKIITGKYKEHTESYQVVHEASSILRFLYIWRWIANIIVLVYEAHYANRMVAVSDCPT